MADRWTVLHGTDRIATADDYRVGNAGELYVYIAGVRSYRVCAGAVDFYDEGVMMFAERSEAREELVPTNRLVTLDANDRILWEGHHGITFGNPEHYAYVTLHYTHEDFRVPVGGAIIP